MDPYSAVPEIRRLRWLVRFAVLWSAIIVARLMYLQVFKSEELGRVADSQQLREQEIRAPRGAITDRNGEELAVSVPVDSLAINPKKIKNVPLAVQQLSRILNMDAKELNAIIGEAKQARRGFAWVKRKITPQESAALRRLGKDSREWVDIRQESRREYPHNELAAHLLGFVDHAEHGVGGIELSLQDDLEGIPGTVRMLTDVKHRGIDELETVAPVPGANVALTIDARLQYVADTELKKAVIDHHCVSGTLVAMDPRNGEVLAMSTYPTFNPNVPLKGRNDLKSRLNRTIAVVNDPGSVFKMFTVGAALECTRLNAKSVIPCGNGVFRFGDQVIHDTHSYGALTLEEVIWKSSNVGAIRIGSEVGKDNLYRYLRAFGFGATTGIELDGESPGLLRPPAKWTAGSLYYVSFGHEVGTTTIQLAQACSVFANGGFRVKPKIVRWRQREGEPRRMTADSPREQVLKKDTAIEMRRISEGVVLYGTGKRAKLLGYTSGGKTGTAQMYDKELRRYVKRYNSTYMGYAPLGDPTVVVVVTLDGSTEFGGVVAAPVFKEVAEAALRVTAQEPDVPVEVKPDQSEKPGDPKASPTGPALLAKANMVKSDEPVRETSHELITGSLVPDLSGMSKRQVVETSVQLGMPVELVGKGIVRSQAPVAGSVLREGERIRVYFGR
ncbi:MAG: transpeptidase family protein [Bryobacterales bacterium]|nr:transpeptidase family protein [Bryobacterales bacterium]